LVIAAVTIGIGMWAHATDRPWQTLTVLALGATQLAVALGHRQGVGRAGLRLGGHEGFLSWISARRSSMAGKCCPYSRGCLRRPALRCRAGDRNWPWSTHATLIASATCPPGALGGVRRVEIVGVLLALAVTAAAR
jgi:hypothetical protein